MADLGYVPVQLFMDKKNIGFRFPQHNGQDLEGTIDNLGYNRHAVRVDEHPTDASGAIISGLHDAIMACAKMSMYEGEAFPGGTARPPVLTHGSHGEKLNPQEYVDFVSNLIRRADDVKVNPAKFGGFKNYQFYQIGDQWVAYNPEYGEGVYILPDIEKCFSQGKYAMRKEPGVSFIPRIQGSPWQGRVWEKLD